MYGVKERNAEFLASCKMIDTHCFVGDTLYDSEMLVKFEEYITRWSDAIKAQKKTDAENAEQDAIDENTKADIRETGRIPANALCPFRFECNECPCNGYALHENSYSCAMARGLVL